MLEFLRGMGKRDAKSGVITAHGFRSMFRTWAVEQSNFPRDVAEMALPHSVGSKLEAPYQRSDMLEKRRELMNVWASYCLPSSLKFVSRRVRHISSAQMVEFSRMHRFSDGGEARERFWS